MVEVFSSRGSARGKDAEGWGKHGEWGVAIAERNKKMLVGQLLRGLGVQIFSLIHKGEY